MSAPVRPGQSLQRAADTLASQPDTAGHAARMAAPTTTGQRKALRALGYQGDVKPSKAQVDSVMEKLFPATKSNRSELQRDRVLQLAESGIGNAPFRGTAWALYQGYTELQDHIEGAGSRRPDADSMRLNRAWFGTGAEAKSRALATIAREVL